MTPRFLLKLPLLLWLGLSFLSGCHPASLVSEVQLEVTVPPETPLNATIFIYGEDPAFSTQPLVYKGVDTFSTQVRLPKDRAVSFTVRMSAPTAQRALNAAGALAPAQSFTPHEDAETLSLSVERWGPASGITTPQTVFLVEAPTITPANDTLWLSGNQPQLGSWNGAEVKLYRAMDGLYANTVSFAANTSLEFKVTRGSWDTVEKSAKGAEVDNHTFKTTGGFERVRVSVGGWRDTNPVPPEPGVLTGNIQYLSVTPNNISLKKRGVIVWLPPDYDSNPTRRYPVLYMHDGQNLMDASTAAYQKEWGVDERADEAVRAGTVEPLIIVGIYNTDDRIPEYTQVAFPPRFPDAGKADLYGEFLVKELKPRIDDKFRTKPEAKYTGLAGSSLGGLVSMYLGMKYPDTFGRLGVISPSVWWANRNIVTQVEALSVPLPLKVWVDIGTNEGDSDQAETVADAQALYDALKAKGWTDPTNLKLTVVEGGQHNEASWNARFADILRYLYPAPTGGSIKAATSGE